MYWPQKFKEKGFVLNIIFFCLLDIELAKERVAMRAEFKGHNVSEETIKYKWKEGYKNMNIHYREFDNILIVDNSRKNEVYSNIIQSLDGRIEQLSESLPEYFERRFPTIFYEIQISKR
jgi:predicted ABC-type ATPase